MGNKILGFILGLVIGVGVGAAVMTVKAKRDSNAAAEAAHAETSHNYSNQIAELETNLATTKKKLDDVNGTNERLSSVVQELLKKNTAAPSEPVVEKPAKKSGFAALFGGDGTNGISAAMSGMMKSSIEQQIEGKMAGLKAKLNLTPQQEAALQELMNKQMSKGMEIAEKMLKGDLTREELERIGKEEHVSQEDQIKALLTPEQRQAYDEYQKEEKSKMARLMANSELLQMQTSLQLTSDQQDKVYAVLAQQAQAQVDPTGGNANFDFGKLLEQKVEALRPILTSDQLERYQKQQQQQLKMIEAFMPKSEKTPAKSP